MAKQSYSDLLKDPRWQKKRLEILQRDNWCCQICGDKRESLQIHHKKYFKNTDPWDYDNSFLITICKTCHDVLENSKDTHKNIDFNHIHTSCFGTENDHAFTIYKYKNGKPLILFKRGSGVYLEKDDIKKIIKILSKW